MFLGNPIPPSAFLISCLALYFFPLVFLSLFNSLVSLSALPPSLSQFLSVELKIKLCHLPTYRTDLCSLGCESAHYSNKYLRGVRGILRATSKTPTHPSKPSVLLVPAGVLFCLLELALIACFSRHLSQVQEQHLAKCKGTLVPVSPRL